MKGYKNFFYLIFWLIFMISMTTEDTIESQEGVTFYAFFTSFLLFAYKEERADTHYLEDQRTEK